MLRWVSISSARRVIDFHPVTFCSGVCDIHTGGGRGHYPSSLYSLFHSLHFPLAAALCQHTRTYVRKHVRSIAGAPDSECNLRNAFRPCLPLLIAISSSGLPGGTGGGTDARVITKALLQPLQLKSYMGTNWDFFFPSLS